MTESRSALAKVAPFVQRARVLVVGRERILRLQKRLRFVLITTDASENTVAWMSRRLEHCPVVRGLTADDVSDLFDLHNARVVGFRKSSLADACYKGISGLTSSEERGAGSEEPGPAPPGV